MMWGYPIWLHANNHSGMRVDKPSAYKNPLGGEYYRIYWWKDFWYPQSSSYIDPWLTKPVWIKTFIFYGMFGMVVNFVTCIRNAVGEAPRKIFFFENNNNPKLLSMGTQTKMVGLYIHFPNQMSYAHFFKIYRFSTKILSTHNPLGQGMCICTNEQ
jgi:hypothetical protein